MDKPEPSEGPSVGQVLLFYNYQQIEDPNQICLWQQELCTRLGLTGKVRIAKEGLNVTVFGTCDATAKYKEEFLQHPLFKDTEIKQSPSTFNAFDGLKVHVVPEAIPTGFKPGTAPATGASQHLEPSEVHELLSHPPEDLMILDVRNYYESRIGYFEGAILPNIRKFSYFPQYIQDNSELFKDKKVFMYCTGGIRCERASSYLKSLNLCKDIYQLHGGIHKYVEEFPEGHYLGKNYVFDNRIALKANDKIVSTCNYCNQAYDDYQKCCREGCFIVSLCCPDCAKKRNNVFHCCPICEELDNAKRTNQEIKKCPCLCQTERLSFPFVTEFYTALQGEGITRKEKVYKWTEPNQQ